VVGDATMVELLMTGGVTRDKINLYASGHLKLPRICGQKIFMSSNVVPIVITS